MAATGDRSGRRSLIRATVIRDGDGVATCTLHPTDPPDAKQLTAWITAEQGSFVCLGECR